MMKHDINGSFGQSCTLPAAFIRAGYDERATMRAWEDLLGGGGGAPDSTVRQVIHASWSRSAVGGISPGQTEAPLMADRHEVAQRVRDNADLLAAAQRSFSAIGRLLEGTGAMLVLADGEGVLLDTIGDREVIHDGMDINLAVGGKWTEDAIGTNGIGTALWTGAPVYVHAAEHFCSGIKGWTCAGAPIRDPIDGCVVGVVDLSGHPDIFQPHNTALAAAAAREIEIALSQHQQEERARLLEAFLSSAPHHRQTDGLVIVDRHGRIIHRNNPTGSLDLQTVLGGRLLDLSPATLERDLAAELPPHLRSCHLRPLKLDGNLRGAALVFPRMPAAQVPDACCTQPPPGVAGAERLKREAAAPIIGESEALLAAVDLAWRVARSSTGMSLLIEGETGVGKELFARLVHTGSRRGPKDPFLALNCGAVTRDLIGGELFGHVAGAFTGALRDGKPGLFERASGGVLSLDEIGEMPLDIQPFLLRVLEDRAVRRIGDSLARPVNVRLVASTNRDLKDEVEAGRFRRDLFYRISAVAIRVPALRERGQKDILLLLDHFNRRIAAEAGGAPLRFSSGALDALTAYRWPGNVRELRNLVERLHILSPGRDVAVHDLPRDIACPAEAAPRRSGGAAVLAPIVTFDEAEHSALRNALAAEGGNLSRVAKRLGISRPTLYRKLSHYGIRRGFS